MERHRYHIRYTVDDEEYNYLKGLRGDTEISVSTLAKHIALQKKTVLLHRNHSMDELLEELILLRKQLPTNYQGLDPDAVAICKQIHFLIQKFAVVWLQ